jgi:SAM-dependent methyltransferase
MEAIRNMYAQMGVDNFYKEHGNKYKNPHTEIINQLLSKVDVGDKILDLCCGSGEVTKNFLNKDIIGCDPYTFNLYQKETGKPVLIFSFKDIATGSLANYQFDTVICSFAMHLCEPSMLNLVLFQLAMISKKLIILTPHKKPEINMYWKLEKEIILNKVRLREYSRTF